MCIRFNHVTRVNGWSGRLPHMVLNDVSFDFPRGKTLAILGARGAGKSTVVRLLSGALQPSIGTVRRQGVVSHPVGTLSWLHRYMTGRENTCFLARLHGFDPRPITKFVLDMSGLGRNFDQPVATYSGEKRARFAFSLSYAVPFDTYIADEALVGGPSAFREQCKEVLRARQASSSFILATRSPALARLFCDAAAILHEGKLQMCESVAHAVAQLAEINARSGGADPDLPVAADDWISQDDDLAA